MPKPERTPHRIELNLREVGQLFNTMDPAPFPEKDLDADAEDGYRRMAADEAREAEAHQWAEATLEDAYDATR